MMGTLGSYPVINGAQNSNALRILDLSGNSIGDLAGTWLSALVEYNRALSELRLAHNELYEEALSALSAAVAGNDTLDVLDLSWNRIRATTTGLSGGVRGAQQFANALKENVRLKCALTSTTCVCCFFASDSPHTRVATCFRLFSRLSLFYRSTHSYLALIYTSNYSYLRF